MLHIPYSHGEIPHFVKTSPCMGSVKVWVLGHSVVIIIIFYIFLSDD